MRPGQASRGPTWCSHAFDRRLQATCSTEVTAEQLVCGTSALIPISSPLASPLPEVIEADDDSNQYCPAERRQRPLRSGQQINHAGHKAMTTVLQRSMDMQSLIEVGPDDRRSESNGQARDTDDEVPDACTRELSDRGFHLNI